MKRAARTGHEMFWNVSFQSLLEPIVGAMQQGRFDDLDAARRLHFLNETTYLTAVTFLDKFGWTADFGPHMSFVARKNLETALTAKPGEQFEVHVTEPRA